MDKTERRQAITALKELIYEDAYSRTRPTGDETDIACRRCGSIAIIRKGHDPDGTQRWLCKDCHRTFRDTPDTIITRSRLKPAVWMRYLECFTDLLPLRECAKRCKVSLRTAWLMRMRLIESIRLHLPDFRADAGMQVRLDETYLRESFKGNHTRDRFRLPRPSRYRGTSASKRGLSKEQICVMTGVDDTGGAFLAMSGRGLLSKDRALAMLHGRLDRGAYAIADMAAAYPPAMKELGVTFTGTDTDSHAINRVNTLYSQLAGFLAGFRGVSTKLLDEYLAWSLWRRTFRDDAADCAARQVSATEYHGTVCEWSHVTPPYMDYWSTAD